MKYIIDLPKEYTSVSALIGEILSVPIQINGGKNYNIPTPIKVTPYIEPDRKAIEDEVWKFARGLLNYTDDDWETITNMLLLDIPYQEAKAKYEAWKKKKDEIHVGDEITLYNNVKLVVVTIDHETSVQGIDENGECYECVELEGLKKTGRHFDEIEELLKKMKKD